MSPFPKVLAAAILAPLLACSPAWADLTLTGTLVGTSVGMSIEGQTTTLLKGRRQRTDAVVRGVHFSTIVDLDAQTVVLIDHEARRAQVFGLIPTPLESGDGAGRALHVEVTATGERRRIGGTTCDEHRVSVSVGVAAGAKTRALITGLAFVSGDSPGAPEWRRFYTAVGDRAFALGDPRAVRADPLRARGLTALQVKLGKLGLTCALRVDFMDSRVATPEGTAVASMSAEVSQISSSTIDDAVFLTPAGYESEQK